MTRQTRPFSPARPIALACLTLALAVAPILADPEYTFTGNLPLPDLGPGTYQGFPGGLYPGGSNTRPMAHLAQGARAAAEITPRNTDGAPDPAGLIIMVSIGLSNTAIEFIGMNPEVPPSAAFMNRALLHPAVNPSLVLVNGAQGGQTAEVWADESSAVWSELDELLELRRFSREQVQVAWVKLAERAPGLLGEFPVHAYALEAHYEQVARILRARFPNLAIAYCSSRTRAYTDGSPTDPTGTRLSPEPYAYESAFGVKWLIERQIQGVPELNCDPALGPVTAPWLTWGPYLWADGLTPRSDGLIWEWADVRSTDSTHPSASGTTKVSSQLLAHFCADATSSWFLRATTAPPAIEAFADVSVGPAPLTVHFSASAGGSVYAWSFDDGTTSLGQNPTKTFPAPGLYLVRLAASDASGSTAVRELRVAVGVDRPAAAVAGGYGHSLALDDGARVRSCGRNLNLQLGGPGADRATFLRVLGVVGARGIAAGFGHSLVVTADGSLWTFGQNFSGQLGDGNTVDSGVPRHVAGLPALAGAAGGNNHSLAWGTDGSVWAWGSNLYGQLGDGSADSSPLPVRVSLPFPATAAAAGGHHGLALRGDGLVAAWGRNSDGQLGDGTLLDRRTAVRVAGLTGAVRLAAGPRHSLAVLADGTVRAWGQNLAGELGDGTTVRRPTPVTVQGLTDVTQIAAGSSFSAALRADGTVFTWGRNANGQLGDGTTLDRAVPAAIDVNGIVAIAAGGEHLLLLRADGEVVVCGRNASGQLGLGSASAPVTLPRENGVDLAD